MSLDDLLPMSSDHTALGKIGLIMNAWNAGKNVLNVFKYVGDSIDVMNRLLELSHKIEYRLPSSAEGITNFTLDLLTLRLHPDVYIDEFSNALEAKQEGDSVRSKQSILRINGMMRRYYSPTE